MTKEPIKTSHTPPPFQNKNFVQEPPPHNLNYMYLDVREVFSLSHANAGWKICMKDLHEMFCTWLLYCQRQFVLIELGYVNGVVKHNVYLTKKEYKECWTLFYQLKIMKYIWKHRFSCLSCVYFWYMMSQPCRNRIMYWSTINVTHEWMWTT